MLLAFVSKSQATNYPAPVFCLVPIDSSLLNHQEDPTPLGSGKQWEVGEKVFDIPRLPSPIIELGHRYWVDSDLKMTEYNQPYPEFGYFNSWVEEPWSSRIIGLNYNISIMPAGDSRFDILIKAPNPDFFSQLEVLPEKRETVVVDADGQPFLVGPSQVMPWLSKNDMAQHGIHGISYLHSSPYLAATIIVDTDAKLHLLKDNGEWDDLGLLDSSDDMDGNQYTVDFHDLPAAKTLIISLTGGNAHYLVIALQKSISGSNSFTIQKIVPSGWFSGQEIYRVSRTFSQLLRFGTERSDIFGLQTPVWQVFSSTGFIDIPGGNTDPDASLDSLSNPSPGFLQDLSSIHLDLIHGGGGLFLYNGKGIVRVLHSSDTEIGNFPWVTDVPAINKDLAVTSMGLFNLTANAKITKVPLPFKFDGTTGGITIENWQEAGVALAITSAGIFTIDQNLNVRPVGGSDNLKYAWNPSMAALGMTSSPTHAEVVQLRDKFWAVIDTELAGASACPTH
jgi:hypothetical protein